MNTLPDYTHHCRPRRVLATLVAIGFIATALAQHEHHNLAPEFDIRGARDLTLPVPATRLSAAREDALGRLQAQSGTDQLEIHWSALTGAPSRIHGFGEPVTLARLASPREIALEFVASHRNLFGLSRADLDELRFSRDYMTDHNQVTHLTLQQQAFGYDVYGGTLKININPYGEIINVSGEPIGGIHDAVKSLSPALKPQQAAQAAAAATAGMVLSGWTDLGLLLFPVSSGDVRLARHVVIRDTHSPNVYETLVDAADGTLLLRKSLTFYNHIPTHGAVYDHSPIPYTPLGTAPPGPVPRADRPFHGGEFFPHDDPHFDWWAGGPRITTISNNVDASADRDGDFSPDPGSYPIAGPGEDFTFPLDLSQQPVQYQDAAVVNLFYWNNRLHDFFYRIGFNEVAGNFQSNNFGLGGTGGDPVLALAQHNAAPADPDDDPSMCNAFMGFPTGAADGNSPRMRMFECDNSSPRRDTDLDAVVIGHEYTHGVHVRLVNTSGNQRANEGWADYFGLAAVANPGDPYDGAYGIGNYSFNNNGIRSSSYSADLSIYPRRYADINDAASCANRVCSSDPTEICSDASDCSNAGDSCDRVTCAFHEDCSPPATAVPLGICTLSEHRTGEVWANALWITRQNLIAKHGFTAGDRRTNLLVIDGMKVSPDDPTFLDGRDAILAADEANNAGTSKCLIWDAFAKMGMGASALTTGVDDINPLQAFDRPAECSATLQFNTDNAFGNVCLGDASSRLLQVFNQGSGDLIVTGVENVSGSGDIQVEEKPATPVFIGAGAHVDFTVRCTPTTLGSKTATIGITSNDESSPHEVIYSCSTASGEINVALADAGSFGNVCKGDHADLNLSLFNQGQCNLTISSIDILPPGSSFELPSNLTLPLVLSPDADFNVPIRYAPEACTDVPEEATIRIVSDDPNNGVVNIDISGTSPCPNLVIDPASLDGLFAFPATVVDSDETLGCYSDASMVLRNNGGCPLLIEDIAAIGIADAADFSVTAPSQFPILLPAGEETLAVNVRFTPQEDPFPLAPTEFEGLLTVISDDPDGDATAGLCGEGVAQSGVRMLVTDVTSGSPEIVDPVERIVLRSKGINTPGPINMTFTNVAAESADVCGNTVHYHVNQENLPSTETTGGSGGGNAAYEARAKQRNLQTRESFTLGQCEFKEFQLQLSR